MRLMYDSVNANAIPTNAQLVAGYVHPSGYTWSDAAWARFPNSVHVKITPQVSTTGIGIHVLDVEKGDATPSQAPGWVEAQRRLGQDPTVYCSSSAWPAVQAAFNATGVAHPHYWIAAYPGTGQNLPSLNGIQAVAHQYADPGPYDLSVVADYWPGVDGEADMPLTQADAQLVVDVLLNQTNLVKFAGTPQQVTAPVGVWIMNADTNAAEDVKTALDPQLNAILAAATAAEQTTTSVTLSADQLAAFESAVSTAVQSAVSGLNLSVSATDQAAIAAAVAKELGDKLSA